MGAISVRSLPGLPEVRPGDDLAALIDRALGPDRARAGLLLAIAHTVVSKAEGALVRLADIEPGARARELGAEQGRDPRAVQVVLDQSQEVLRAANGVLICRTHHGFVCANAGVDASNAGDADTLVLLPRDPDDSARRLRRRLGELAGARGIGGAPAAAPAVLISDTFGRAWRHGQTDVAIGLAGLAPLDDWRGRRDADGVTMRATWLALADAAAGAADLARAKDSREPVIAIEGLEQFITAEDGPGAGALLRPVAEDLFQ